MNQDKVVFLDLETTGLSPDRHEIWEIGFIRDNEEHHWFLPVDLGLADPYALEIGHFWDQERHDGYLIGCDMAMSDPNYLSGVAGGLAWLLRGRHIVGAVPSFDDAFLKRFMAKHHQPVTWHYHLIDIESMIVGFLNGLGVHSHMGRDELVENMEGLNVLPWNSDGLTEELGVEPPTGDERHTALGDARWVKAQWEAMFGV